MVGIKKVATATLAALALGSCLMMSGCGTEGSREVSLDPTVSGSSLVTEGVLTVGVDSTLAPFGGVSNGEIIGLDVDVAAALATELGLELEIVDISGEDFEALLDNDELDIVMNVSATQALSSSLSLVGPYVENGPAIFASDDREASEFSLDYLATGTVGAYENSAAARAALSYTTESHLETYTSLSDAFEALADGEIDYVASDSVAGGYLSMSYEGIAYMTSLQDPSGVYIGVSNSYSDLITAVQDALETIYSNGVLEVVVAKWVSTSCAASIIPSSGIELIDIDTTDTNEESSSNDSGGESSNDESSADEPAADESTADESSTDESTADETADETASDESASDESSADDTTEDATE